VAASLAMATSAGAGVRLEGKWPDADKPVSLDATGISRAQALRKLADAAGWSFVVRGTAAGAVDVHVKRQPASKVLDLLLDDADYVAKRDGMLVSIDPVRTLEPPQEGRREFGPKQDAATAADASGSTADAESAAEASAPSEPPPAGPKQIRGGRSDDAVHRHGQERTVMGGDVHILRGETVREVTVFGGNVDIAGEVTGDVTVFGGSAKVHEGAHVHGDATVLGGRLVLDEGSRVDGDVDAIGGTVVRDPGARVGGSGGTPGEEDDDETEDGAARESPPALPVRVLTHVARGVRLAAVLFVFGTVLLALAGRRMNALRQEMAVRPMRSLALGVVGALASVLVLVALCVTVIGIPIAVVALIVAIFAVLGGMCAVLSVAGEGLLRHKTENPYVHLAAGCALFVALASIPWAGELVVAAVAFAGVGVLVGTRAAGILLGRARPLP
jgi:hypothetical protein